MKWNVYYYNFNKGKIETFNIFNHWKFEEDVMKDLGRYKTRDEFGEALRRNLFYYFGSKCEWEVLISPWVSRKDGAEIKIDVYNQVMLNWEQFLEYVWTQRK